MAHYRSASFYNHDKNNYYVHTAPPAAGNHPHQKSNVKNDATEFPFTSPPVVSSAGRLNMNISVKNGFLHVTTPQQSQHHRTGDGGGVEWPFFPPPSPAVIAPFLQKMHHHHHHHHHHEHHDACANHHQSVSPTTNPSCRCITLENELDANQHHQFIMDSAAEQQQNASRQHQRSMQRRNPQQQQQHAGGATMTTISECVMEFKTSQNDVYVPCQKAAAAAFVAAAADGVFGRNVAAVGAAIQQQFANSNKKAANPAFDASLFKSTRFVDTYRTIAPDGRLTLTKFIKPQQQQKNHQIDNVEDTHLSIDKTSGAVSTNAVAELRTDTIRELDALAQLQHPNIIKLLDMQLPHFDGKLFYVLEYRGHTMRAYLDENAPIAAVDSVTADKMPCDNFIDKIVQPSHTQMLLAFQLLAAVEFMHARHHLCHLALTADTIYISPENFLTIGDFECSQRMPSAPNDVTSLQFKRSHWNCYTCPEWFYSDLFTVELNFDAVDAGNAIPVAENDKIKMFANKNPSRDIKSVDPASVSVDAYLADAWSVGALLWELLNFIPLASEPSRLRSNIAQRVRAVVRHFHSTRPVPCKNHTSALAASIVHQSDPLDIMPLYDSIRNLTRFDPQQRHTVQHVCMHYKRWLFDTFFSPDGKFLSKLPGKYWMELLEKQPSLECYQMEWESRVMASRSVNNAPDAVPAAATPALIQPKRRQLQAVLNLDGNEMKKRRTAAEPGTCVHTTMMARHGKMLMRAVSMTAAAPLSENNYSAHYTSRNNIKNDAVAAAAAERKKRAARDIKASLVRVPKQDEMIMSALQRINKDAKAAAKISKRGF